MTPSDKLASRTRNITEDVLYEADSIPKSCGRLRAEGNASREVEAWLRLALRGTELLGIRLRYEGQIDAARDALKLARWATQQAVDAFAHHAARGVPAGTRIARGSLPSGFVIAWLAQDTDLEAALCRLNREPVVVDTPGEGDFGQARDLFGHMCAALAEKDVAGLERWRGRFEEEVALVTPQDPYWRDYFRYPAAMSAIAQGDVDVLESSLDELDGLFAARSKDKRTSQLPLADAPPPLNTVMIDYRATALGVLAISRGMATTFDRPAIPAGTIAGWKSPAL